MKIDKNIIDEIIAHAAGDLPNECCGYLAGKSKNVTATYPLRNIDESHEHFSFSPEDQFVAIRDMRDKGLETIAVYHSHPKTPARPSDEDIRLAFDPSISYVIISMAQTIPDIQAFRIKNNQVSPEVIEII